MNRLMGPPEESKSEEEELPGVGEARSRKISVTLTDIQKAN